MCIRDRINSLEERIQQLREAAEADGGRSAREFQGEGNRQYLTGLKLGGNRIAIMLDVSASMLAPEVVNVIRLRNQSDAKQRSARKWVQALGTVDWLTAQLPTGSCLLYTSDAADDLTRVDLGGRRIIKKKKTPHPPPPPPDAPPPSLFFFFFSSRRRHTRFLYVSWARRCV